MKYRKHKDFTVSEVGIGCYALSGAYGAKDVKEFKQMLDHAHDLGVNFFDTADTYGNAERILGETVKPYRDDVHIATKVGVKGEGEGEGRDVKPDLSGKYVKFACEQSLKRMQTDYINLYQVHFDDPDTSIEETVDALEIL
jgi:Predicted oxidoreductases (related to aryl-alcohol dehydrogenases)